MRIDVEEALKDEEKFGPEMQDRDNQARLAKLKEFTQTYAVQVNDIYEAPKHFPIDMYFQRLDVLKSPVMHSTATIRCSPYVLNLRAIANSRTKTDEAANKGQKYFKSDSRFHKGVHA